MDIRTLRYFLAVAREENITRAAESLHLAQPSLSKQMMELEKELGCMLLVRGKRKVTLTEEGVLLRKRAEEIVGMLDRTEQEFRSSSQSLSGKIAIGGNPNLTILQAAAAIRMAHPEVSFDFYSGDAIDVTDRLDHGSLDFSLFLEPVDLEKYERLPLLERSAWGVLMPQDSPLSRNQAITRELLCKIPLIFHRRPGLQHRIATWAETSPEQMQIAATYNVVNGDPVNFVKSGLGYFLTTRDLLPDCLSPEVCFRPLTPTLETRYALVWKQSAVLSQAARAFLEELKMQLAKQADGMEQTR